ncbi:MULTISPECIES: anti-sigma factor [unclassified Sporosarcina]|uniref:anti-sigma factor n=1 Tax=unclassified Sporosarcina TaxID=2647733 RepID=UPI000C16B419|nr:MULTISPECIES: anti-sigma factor [unclassified Sporosarcina]PIC99471.1 hypothetical protein CSV68_08215 [Sporosarcina sp. P29]PID06294.1 hypothetical protein CSV66_05480 [Sporosarcina sp. P30]PID09488.1 hypothetical protein CSV65_05480 [Sporosarcina sp. P31]PID12786.1 hypothetical protein CSV64_04945 [Sporosarcina sp. P32b]
MNKSCHMLIDYFNRTLTDVEMRQFEDHLIECPSCQEELMEWEMLTEDLPYESEAVEVPTDLKARVFASLPDESSKNENVMQIPVKEKSRRPLGVATSILAAGLFASLVANAFLFTEMQKEPDIAQSEIQLIGQSILAPEEGTSASAVAMLIADGDQEVLLLDATDLPTLSADELYQVWVIEGDQPYPAGIVQPNETGTGTVSHPLADLSGTWDTVAITIEKEPNLPAPEGQIILAGGI